MDGGDGDELMVMVITLTTAWMMVIDGDDVMN